jgi:hypothetical protein
MKKKLFFLCIFIVLFSLPFANPITTQADSLTVDDLPEVRTLSVSSVHAPNSYNLIRDALLVGEPSVQFDQSEISFTEVGELIRKVMHENPEIMYYDGGTIWSNGKIDFDYAVSPSVVQAHQAQLQAEVDKVLSAVIKTGFTDFDKVKAIHDYLALNTAYDYDNFNNDAVPAASYTAYGSLIKGIAVCDGYTKAAQIMLNRLGIENYYVDGYGNGVPHSWNLVKLDGHYYFMDITWDDPVPDRTGRVRYAYFLTTSEQLRKDHQWVEANWPTAISTKYNYFNEFNKMIEVDGYYYFSSNVDNDKLYKIAKDGSDKQQINNIRAPYFAISGDWIYFSNYSNGGYLYKIKKDGSQLQQLNSVHSTDLSISGNVLHFTNNETNHPMTLTIETTKENSLEPIGDIVSSNKKWTVTFNKEIDVFTINPQNITVQSETGETIPVLLGIDPNNWTKLIVYPPNGGYEQNTNYILTIQNMKSTTGQALKTTTKQLFYVK